MFEPLLMTLYWQKNEMLIHNYISDAGNDITTIDKQIYKVLSDNDLSEYPFLLRTLVDTSPECSYYLNKIDNYKNYENDVSDADRNDKERYRLKVARAMKEDVLALMRIREEKSLDLGFESYTELVLSLDGLSKEKLRSVLKGHLDESLDHVKALIKDYGIKWPTWFSDLDKICESKEDYSTDVYMQGLMSKLGFDVKAKLNLEVGSDFFASFVMTTSKEDIHVFIKESNTLGEVLTLYHELGHAFHYSMIEGDGLKNILPPSLSEIMAVVMEFLASQIFFEEGERKKLNDLMLIDYTRCAVSALFELDLWEDMSEPEALYLKHYSKLGIEIGNPAVWSYDSFRSIDPLYIHNYVLGYTIAKKMYKKLKSTYGDDYRQWGAWLVEHIYKHGSKLVIQDVMKMCKE